MVAGLTSEQACTINDGADALANHAAKAVAPPAREARAILDRKRMAALVQRRIGAAVQQAAAAGSLEPPARLPQAKQRRRLRDQLDELGHATIASGKSGLKCSRCHSRVTAAVRRHWIADGRCRGLDEYGAPVGGATVRFGSVCLHGSHDLRWDARKEAWHCLGCTCSATKRSRTLRLPCCVFLDEPELKQQQQQQQQQKQAPSRTDTSACVPCFPSVRWGEFINRVKTRIAGRSANG